MISSVNIPHGVVGAPKARHIIIVKAYKDWIQSVQNKKVWNRSLNNYIHINALSITETANWASLSYWSTYAVLHLDYILRYAEKDGPTRTPKPNENQSKFSKIQIMKCYVAKIGWVKMTVGILRSDGRNIQYCITALHQKRT